MADAVEISIRLPGISAWAALPCSTGITGSRSPQTISVGMASAR